MITETRRAPARHGFSLRRLLARLVALEGAYRQRADLAALDDRMLRDVGLTRADVDAELRRPLFAAFDPTPR